MSDGPFKNLNLNRKWQRFVNALQNSATDRSECAELAYNACLSDILSNRDTEFLIKELLQHSQVKQIDFDQAAYVDKIFFGHSQTFFSEILHTEILYHLDCGLSLNRAFGKGLDASINRYIGIVKTRIEEEIIRSAHERDIKRRKAAHAIGLTRNSLLSLDKKKIHNALISADKNAFRTSRNRRSGLDDGPSI